MSDIRERGDLPVEFTEYPYPQIQGARSIGFIDCADVCVEDETITIGGRIYEFSADGLALTTGDVRIDVSAALTPAVSAPAIVSAINGDAYASVSASLLADNIVALYVDSNGVNAITLSTTSALVVVSAAAFTGGLAEAQKQMQYGTYTVTGVDVTTLGTVGGTANIPLAVCTFEGTPVLTSFVVRNSTNHLRGNAIVDNEIAVSWALITGSLYELTLDDLNAALDAGDIITWSAIG